MISSLAAAAAHTDRPRTCVVRISPFTGPGRVKVTVRVPRFAIFSHYTTVLCAAIVTTIFAFHDTSRVYMLTQNAAPFPGNNLFACGVFCGPSDHSPGTASGKFGHDFWHGIWATSCFDGVSGLRIQGIARHDVSSHKY